MLRTNTLLFVVATIVFGLFLAIGPYLGHAQEEAPRSDTLEIEKPTPMNNQRLGKLLKQHFPKARFVQTGPPVWAIQTETEDEAAETPRVEENGQADPESNEQEEAQVDYEGLLMVITDENANRMRIMMPIQPFDPEKAEDLQTALIALHANYDRALDARYAISEGFLWSAFIHPLGSLTENDLDSALQQVQTLRQNTGTSYSSGALIFGGGQAEEAPEEEERPGDRTI